MARRTTVSLAQFGTLYPELKARGASDAAIARELGLSHMTVSRWKKTLSATKTGPADASHAPQDADMASRIVEALHERRRSAPLSLATLDRPSGKDLLEAPDSRITALQEENELLKRLLAEHLLANALERAKARL